MPEPTHDPQQDLANLIRLKRGSNRDAYKQAQDDILRRYGSFGAFTQALNIDMEPYLRHAGSPSREPAKTRRIAEMDARRRKAPSSDWSAPALPALPALPVSPTFLDRPAPTTTPVQIASADPGFAPSFNRPSPKPFFAPSAQPASQGTYLIQQGDTLSGLARRHNTSVDALAQLNNIADPNRIYAGHTLQLPEAAGRHGDDQMAHVQTGEVVVPRELASTHPQIMQAISKAIAELGGDPASRVVGAPEGNFNPTTNRQEFFFKDMFSIDNLVPALAGVAGAEFLGGTQISKDLTLSPAVAAGLGSGGAKVFMGGDLTSAAVTGLGAYAGHRIGAGLQGENPSNNYGALAGAFGGSLLAGGLMGGPEQAPDPYATQRAANPFGPPRPPVPTAAPPSQPIDPRLFAPGVSYLSSTIDRNTGRPTLTPSSGFDDDRRRSSWASMIGY